MSEHGASDRALTHAMGTSFQGHEPEGLCLPEKSALDWGIALGLFILSCLYLRLFYNYTVLDADEGIILQGAQRVLNGQVVYRDFFSFYTPGSYYWNALLLKVFGDSILVPRMALVVYGGIFAVLTYFIARRVCSRWPSILVAYLVTICCLPYWFMVLHNWDSTLWAYAALYCAVWFLQSRHWAWALAMGSFTSLCALFEQSKGAGLLLGLALGLLLLARSELKDDLFSGARLVAMAVGLLWPGVLTLAYFGSQQALQPMLTDLLWPLKLFFKVAKVPYGYLTLSDSAWHLLHSGSLRWRAFAIFVFSPAFLVPVLPLLALGLLAYFAFRVRGAMSAGTRTRNAYYVLVCSILGGLLLSVVVVRPGVPQFFYLPPFMLVLAWVIDGRAIPLPRLTHVRPLLTLYILFSFSAFGIALLANPLNARYPLSTRRGTLKSAEPDQALTYIQASVPAGGRIFVYPYQPLYYYLTATENPTGYEYLQPGMHTPEQFESVAHQLAANPPRFVLFTHSFLEIVGALFPETPVEALTAKDPVEEYIFAHYQPCTALASGRLWHYVFMVRKDLRCPGSSSRQ